MEVLAIVGSPHKGGNTEILTRRVLDGADEEGAQTEIIRLAELDINYCKACHKCLKEGMCATEDDAKWVIKSMLEADGIVLGSSTQAQIVSGQMKVFLDRLILHFFRQSLRGKYVVSVSVGGFYGAKKVTRYLNDAGWAMGAFKVGSVAAHCWETGGISKDEKALGRARDLGRRLAKAIKAETRYGYQGFVRRIGPFGGFGKAILACPNQMPHIYEYWKERGWL